MSVGEISSAELQPEHVKDTVHMRETGVNRKIILSQVLKGQCLRA